ncbi:serine hydrolase domain-containing protein [Cerasicoccus frondis]|uniref:serine hydrolase domain-containing protein n=1 Tax=Cerasicoccus frondis TaxID=490090 RepID=UPI002852AD26|nr:serine hydrolase domain-containing protein [Cerasicoccus frondis]
MHYTNISASLKIRRFATYPIIAIIVMFNASCNNPEQTTPSFDAKVGLTESLRLAMAATETPGALLAWQQGDNPAQIVALGVSNIDLKTPITSDVHMLIGSVTKLFTSQLALLLVQEGKLSPNDKISQYVTGVPRGDEITLRQLANHTSGLPDAISNPQFQKAIMGKPDRQWTARKILAYAFEQESHFPPGEGWRYANTNTILLALAAQGVSDQKIDELISRYILTPYGLDNSGFTMAGALPEPNSHGYRFGAQGRPIGYGEVFYDVTEYSPSWSHAAGAMYSTIDDLIAIAKALAQGDLLNEETRAELHQYVQTGDSDWQYAWGIELFGKMVGHRGDVPGYQCCLAYVPSLDLAIVAMTNLSNDQHARGPANMLANIIYEYHLQLKNQPITAKANY